MLRRSLLAMPLIAARPAHAEVDVASAEQFIRSAGDELVQIVTGAGDADVRRRRLEPFIERVVDVDGVAHFCLGRYWSSASESQRGQYARLFHVVLVNSIAGHLGQYRSGEVRLVTGRASPRPEGVLVPTTIEQPNNRPVTIGWIVVGEGGQLRIADVVAEGVSLRITQRSDYASFLSRNNGDVAALIHAMQSQVDGMRLSQR